MTVVGYARVSTEEQAASGLSLENQEAKMRHWAAMSDLDIEIVRDAGWSSRNMNRPGIQGIIERIKRREIKCLVVAKLDRLTRNKRDLWDMVDLCNKLNVEFVSINETLDTRTAAGRMIISILGSLAEWEREEIGERTKAALSAKKMRGERLGNIPYGYQSTPDGKLEKCEDEQEVIAFMRAERERGASLRDIAKALNANGTFTRSGTFWRYQYVANILAKEEK